MTLFQIVIRSKRLHWINHIHTKSTYSRYQSLMKYQRIFFTFCELFVFSAINLFARHALIFKADIFRSHYRQERNYDFWLGSLAKFPLSENSDKIRLTELAKNQTFPLFMTFLRLMLALQQPDSPHYKAEHSGHVTSSCAFSRASIATYNASLYALLLSHQHFYISLFSLRSIK